VKVGTSIGFQNPLQWRMPWPELYAQTIEFVRRAEAAGLDEVWISEHHFVDDGYCPSIVPAAAAIAAATERIRIGSKVILLPFHDPLRLAEDVAVADVISGGRIDLGVAAGYRRAEFEGFGVDPSERGARMREGLDVLVKALSGEAFSHDGRFFRYGRAQVVPPPVQQPIPLWLGGRTRAAMRRAARYRAHLALADFVVDNCAEDYGSYAAALAEDGLGVGDFEVVAVASIFLDEDPERAWAIGGPHLLYQQNQYQQWFREAGDRPNDDFELATRLDDLRAGSALVGTPTDVADRLREFHARVPFTQFSFWCLLPGLPPDHALGSLDLFVRDVLPVLHELGAVARA
jgi:alkanesulfonate monooxygenase SsuD/methylene tetrahydromethanopterin reductase-like flavin-dependent oxidoreductase (luciferase family)